MNHPQQDSLGRWLRDVHTWAGPANHMPGDARRIEHRQDLKERTLVFIASGGLGDSIQFVRYAMELQPHCKKLVLLVARTAVRLFRTLPLRPPFAIERFHDSKALAALCREDSVCWMWMTEAPLLLGARVAAIPRHGHYFSVPESVWQARRLPPKTKRLRVGIAWAAGGSHKNIPFAELKPLLELNDIEFISLQRPNHRPGSARITPIIRRDFNLLDTGAIIIQLDLCITVDTAVAHLAGALGRPLWLLLLNDACPRWDSSTEDHCPWYPNLRVFRQDKMGSWENLVKRVRAELLLMINPEGQEIGLRPCEPDRNAALGEELYRDH